MTTLIAGVSGAIGCALAKRYLERTDETVIGLCRRPDRMPDRLRNHARLQLLPWQSDMPDTLPEDRLGFGLLVQALAPHLRGRHLKRVAAICHGNRGGEGRRQPGAAAGSPGVNE